MWEPGLPISPGTIDQADQQQFLSDYPGILWGALVSLGNAILDINTRIHVFLNTFYGTGSPIPTNVLMVKYLAEELSGEYTARVKQLIDDATA